MSWQRLRKLGVFIRFYLYGKLKGESSVVTDDYVRLFCYGMLKRGQGLSKELEKAGGRFYAPCRVYDYTLYTTSYGVAVMVQTDPFDPNDPSFGYFVDGELWTVPTKVLPLLDQIEGGYDRVTVKVTETVEGKPFKYEAFAYVDNYIHPSWKWIGARWGA